VIAFEVCRDPKDAKESEKFCEPEEKIMNWIKRKFLIVLEN